MVGAHLAADRNPVREGHTIRVQIGSLDRQSRSDRLRRKVPTASESKFHHLLPRYNCQFADPSAEALNAVTKNWRGEDNWIHPPVDLLPDVALKLRLQPCHATIVAPYWPDKAWFRELRELRELSQKIEVRQSTS